MRKSGLFHILSRRQAQSSTIGHTARSSGGFGNSNVFIWGFSERVVRKMCRKQRERGYSCAWTRIFDLLEKLSVMSPNQHEWVYVQAFICVERIQRDSCRSKLSLLSSWEHRFPAFAAILG